MSRQDRRKIAWLGPESQKGQGHHFCDAEFYDLGPVISIEGEREAVVWSCGKRGHQEEGGQLRWVESGDEYRAAFPDGRLPSCDAFDSWDQAGEPAWFEVRISDAGEDDQPVRLYTGGFIDVVLLAHEVAGQLPLERRSPSPTGIRSVAEAMRRR